MIPDDLRRIHAHVSGRVQGVYFRASTHQEAGRLGLWGWVRNAPDGRVELDAEGPAERVADLIGWLHDGPPAARVERVEIREEPPTASGGAFEVRY